MFKGILAPSNMIGFKKGYNNNKDVLCWFKNMQ